MGRTKLRNRYWGTVLPYVHREVKLANRAGSDIVKVTSDFGTIEMTWKTYIKWRRLRRKQQKAALCSGTGHPGIGSTVLTIDMPQLNWGSINR